MAVPTVLIASCELPAPPVTTAGVKVELPTEGGSPVRDNETSPANPFRDDTLTLDVVEAPATTL